MTGGRVVRIADDVREIARADPDRVALVHARDVPILGRSYRRYTYRELSDKAESLAVGLRRIGVGEGTLCSFMVPPCFDAVVLGVALWRVGAVIVGIEPHSHGLRRVARCLRRVGPEFFFGTPQAHAGRVVFGWGRGTIRTNVVVGPLAPPGMHTLDSLCDAREAEPVQGDVAPEDLAVIAFTTGSTGEPKPTALRHRNLAAMVALVTEHWGFVDGREIVDMPTFPMFWIIGLSTGGTVVVPPMDFALKGPGDADPAKLMRTIDECGVRSMFGSPALLTNLARYAADHGESAPSLRRIICGGAEVPGPLFAAVKEMLGPDGEMYSDYGATEALPIAEIAGDTVLGETWKATEDGAGVCVGEPLPGVEVRIVAVDDATIASWDDAEELPAGEIGEVVARSPHISEDYYEAPDATAANKIPDPTGVWHRLGDTGYLDDSGRLWVCGRHSHRVVTPDGVVYPLCCEPVFNTHPAVARSALVGVDRGAGVEATLVVERSPGSGVSDDDLRRELLAVAAAHESTELVATVVFVGRIPVDRRHNAKIDRPAIARSLAED
ncbi:MAG: fatty acid CoA ligase family protein [Acidimicrobiia bacterium]